MSCCPAQACDKSGEVCGTKLVLSAPFFGAVSIRTLLTGKIWLGCCEGRASEARASFFVRVVSCMHQELLHRVADLCSVPARAEEGKSSGSELRHSGSSDQLGHVSRRQLFVRSQCLGGKSESSMAVPRPGFSGKKKKKSSSLRHFTSIVCRKISVYYFRVLLFPFRHVGCVVLREKWVGCDDQASRVDVAR